MCIGARFIPALLRTQLGIMPGCVQNPPRPLSKLHTAIVEMQILLHAFVSFATGSS